MNVLLQVLGFAAILGGSVLLGWLLCRAYMGTMIRAAGPGRLAFQEEAVAEAEREPPRPPLTIIPVGQFQRALQAWGMDRCRRCGGNPR
jgi:hypothetical protein